MTSLDVVMDGKRIGTLAQRRGDLRFQYVDDGLSSIGAPLVSVALPTQRAPYVGSTPRAFFDGLLPEGSTLRMLAYDFSVREDDTVGLLRALGRDCAGALQILPADERADARGTGALEPVSSEGVGDRIRALRHAPLGVDERVRISLAGVQEKLLLARTEHGWALPLDGAPSTHILKPAHPLLPHSVANEALCLAIARNAELDVTAAVVETFADRPVLVVERFDRTRGDRPRRIHQEDMCQATGTPPRRKYEEAGGPSLVDCARTLREWTRGAASIERMAQLVVLNVVLGNADAHGKNMSILHHDSGGLELAPAYDLLSTRYYEGVEPTLGMFVNGVRHVDDVTRADLVAEVTSWRVAAARAAALVDELLERLPAAIYTARADVPSAPDDLVDLIRARHAKLCR